MGEGDYEGCCGGCCATFFLWLVGELVVEQIWGLGNVYVWVTIACVVGLLGCIIFPFVAKFIADRRASQRQKQVNYVLEQQAYAQEQEAYVRWQEADARGRAAAWETAKINEWKRSGMGKAVTDRAVPAPDPVHLAVAKATQPGGAGQAEVRQALVENLSELVRAIGLEAAELVSRLAALPDNGCAAGLFRTHIIGYETWSPAQNGARLTAEAADIVLEVFAWSTSRSRLLAGVHPVAAKMLSGPLAPLDARLHALVKRRARFDHRGSLVNDSDDVFLGDGRGPEPCLPPEEWPEFVRDLLRVLSGVRDGLATVAAPAPLPVLSPPGFARLRVEVAAETVTQGLETFLRRTNGLLQAATAGPRPSELTGTGCWTTACFAISSPSTFSTGSNAPPPGSFMLRR